MLGAGELPKAPARVIQPFYWYDEANRHKIALEQRTGKPYHTEAELEGWDFASRTVIYVREGLAQGCNVGGESILYNESHARECADSLHQLTGGRYEVKGITQPMNFYGATFQIVSSWKIVRAGK